MAGIYFLLLAILVVTAYYLGSSRARSVVNGNLRELHSLPAYHGLLATVMVLVPMLAIFVIGTPIANRMANDAAIAAMPPELQADQLRLGGALRNVTNIVSGRFSAETAPELKAAADAYASTIQTGNISVIALGVAFGLAGLAWSLSRTNRDFRARNRFEYFVKTVLWAAAGIAVLTTVGIVLSLVGETYRFFFDPNIKGKPEVFDFLFGLDWNPQAAMRADQGELNTSYGIVPLLAGTLLITGIAILVAGPLGLFSAVYLSEYASPRVRAFAKPMLEILAGIPTVVLGFFAALTVAPLIRGWGENFGLSVSSESALAAGLVMGMMIIPLISSLSDDVINAVPQSLRDGAYALGATKSEAVRRVVLPAALPGIVSAFILAISSAIGETMIVVMAAGFAANLTANPLEAVTTITVQISALLVGDQEFDSAKTLSAFALGFVLFFITLILNFIALRVVQRYREQYD